MEFNCISYVKLSPKSKAKRTVCSWLFTLFFKRLHFASVLNPKFVVILCILFFIFVHSYITLSDVQVLEFHPQVKKIVVQQPASDHRRRRYKNEGPVTP